MFSIPTGADQGGTPPSPHTRPRLVRWAVYALGGVLALGLLLSALPSTEHTPASGTARSPITGRAPSQSAGTLRWGHATALLLLAGGGAWALHLRHKATRPGSAQGPLVLLSTVPLGPSQQLQVVRCGDDVHLLGVTASQITLLKTYAADAFDMDACTGDGARPSAPSWTDLLTTASTPSSHA